MYSQELLDAYASGKRNFRGANLAGIFLKNVDLSCCIFSYADFSFARLENVNLSFGNLNNSIFSGAVLIDVDLTDTSVLGMKGLTSTL